MKDSACNPDQHQACKGHCDGDGWDRMRHGSTEITHFSHIHAVIMSVSLNTLDAYTVFVADITQNIY